MPAKLNQIVAVEKSIKSQSLRNLTNLHQDLLKTDLLKGISRKYLSRDDEGEKLPSESTKVQVSAKEYILRASEEMKKDMDITLTKDAANTKAFADIRVGDAVIAKQVPISTLLYLEKQMVSWKTFMEKVPVLDPSENWVFNAEQNCYSAEPVQSTRTKKVPRSFVKAEATDKHPAQVDVYHEDVIVGYWTTVKFSGAVPAQFKADSLSRLDKLVEAIKYAREEANSIEVDNRKIGDSLFSFLIA